MIKLAAGQVWKTHGGWEVTILGQDLNYTDFPVFEGSNLYLYCDEATREDGSKFIIDERLYDEEDLVELIHG